MAVCLRMYARVGAFLSHREYSCKCQQVDSEFINFACAILREIAARSPYAPLDYANLRSYSCCTAPAAAIVRADAEYYLVFPGVTVHCINNVCTMAMSVDDEISMPACMRVGRVPSPACSARAVCLRVSGNDRFSRRISAGMYGMN